MHERMHKRTNAYMACALASGHKKVHEGTRR
jgi:hypothetical protein